MSDISLQEHHHSALLTCLGGKTLHLANTRNAEHIDARRLWRIPLSTQTGFRNSTIAFLLQNGLLEHTDPENNQPTVTLSAAGLAYLKATFPEHPLFNTPHTNRSRIRLITSRPD